MHELLLEQYSSLKFLSFPSLFILHLSGNVTGSVWSAAPLFLLHSQAMLIGRKCVSCTYRFRKLLQRDQRKRHVFQIGSGCSVSKTHRQSATPQNPSFYITSFWLLYLQMLFLIRWRMYFWKNWLHKGTNESKFVVQRSVIFPREPLVVCCFTLLDSHMNSSKTVRSWCMCTETQRHGGINGRPYASYHFLVWPWQIHLISFDSVRVGLCLLSHKYPQIGSSSIPRKFQLARACERLEIKVCTCVAHSQRSTNTIFVSICLKILCHSLLLDLVIRHASRDGCFHKTSSKSCLVPQGFCCPWLHAMT